MLKTHVELEQPWRRQHVRTPRTDEALLSIPPLVEAAELARANAQLLQSAETRVQGRPLNAVRDWARREVWAAARAYTATWCQDPAPAEVPELLAVSGHQPILYHPGVWVKNFAVGQLAQRHAAVSSEGRSETAPAAPVGGLNLVVDNDTLTTCAVRVPRGRREVAWVETVPFDDPRPAQPWEDATVQNEDLFARFGERVTTTIAGDWEFSPLATDFWPLVLAHRSQSDRLADCFTAARNQLERRWGCHNLELPLSRLCELESFQWFACHLLAHLPRLHAIYNDTLSEFRQVNRVRSRTHPVPDLRARDGWLEAPFWVWRKGDEQRQRVYARSEGREIWLSDGESVFARLPLTPDGDACCAVKVLAALPAQGIRFRTRALTTTLFARLCFADMFVHGIGGAKYDEMTDRLIARFFGIAPPRFLMLTATVQLPIPPNPVTRADELRVRSYLRELDFHAERYMGDLTQDSVPDLIAQKSALIAQQQRIRAQRLSGNAAPSGNTAHVRGRGPGYERFKRLQEVNRALASCTTDERRRAEAALREIQRQLTTNAILQDREYAFCLYPAEKLRHFMTQIFELDDLARGPS